jgi:hypothetical protein
MDLDFADVKPSVISWLIVGLMAVTFIVLLKYAVQKFPVPGLSEVILSV